EDDKVETMLWYPKAADEIAEAQRFYDMATWRSWTTLDDLERLLATPGPWLIRWNAFGTFMFLCSSDERLLFEVADAETISRDVSDAVRFTSAQALDLIRRLMADWELGDSGIYFEPVRPEAAESDGRLQWAESRSG